MTCWYPIKAYRSQERHPETGRYGITFNPTRALVEGSSLQLPCGRCTGCRADRAEGWAVRIMHEAQLYQANAFVTLTFSDEHLPPDYGVHVRDVQLFMKRLRKAHGSGIRFYACGEYGDLNLRPHYHLILFNHDFADKKLHSSNNGNRLYVSDTLSNLWSFGHATTGDVTYQSAGYVARYAMKKQTGERAASHYRRVHPITGIAHQVRPEFTVMSRRPGVGAAWLKKFKGDVWPSGYVVINGKMKRPPRFYEKTLTEQELESVKRSRKAFARKKRADNTPARLKVREQCQAARLTRLKRNLE